MNSELEDNSECAPMATGSLSKRLSECSEEEERLRKIPKLSYEEAALYQAGCCKNEDIFQMFLSEDASTDFEFEGNPLKTMSKTKLHVAVSSKNPSAVHAILQSDPSLIDMKDSEGNTALHYATGYGHEEIVKMLLAKGAIPHLQNRRGQTPLHIIVSGPFYAEEEDDIYSEDEDDEYRDVELQESVDERYIRVMKELIAAGADLLLQDKWGRTPLHMALHSENKLGAEVLVEGNSENNLQDVRGNTPLHLAVQEQVYYFKIVKKLLAAGVSTRIQNNQSNTPLFIALNHGYTALANILVDADSENNLPDGFGLSPLHQAAREGRVPIARKLLFCGAHPHTKARNEDRFDTGRIGYPLGIAMYYRRSTIVELILLACALRGIVIDWEKDLDFKIALSWMDKFPTIQFYKDLCVGFDLEVQKMKAAKIHRTTLVSYYDFARKHERKLALYLKNKNVETVLNSINISDHLPNYGHLITFKIHRAKKRRALIARCLKCFYVLGKKLPSVLKINTDTILDCLSERDMQNFVKAFNFKA
ncbi:ankyrin-1-like [Uloborus diversus]|uniref:ankyrin-1-like n=1 Tax=Uloborus diversus TaxID=327109 RepID=UPI00240A3089|nr:ankyrin-1-like [Uloborus diversus]